MAADGDMISIGNVKFASDQVDRRGRAFSKTGEPLEVIFMKNGTKLTFPKQDNSKLEPAVIERGSQLKFFGIKGLCIEGSENNDNYSIVNCDDYTVDVQGGGTDTIDISHSKGFGQIARDDNDMLYTGNEKIDMNNVVRYEE
jgi:hypothetical protein